MNTATGVRAVLLAAGRASRFGEAKLLHPLPDGGAIGVHAARNLRAAGLQVTAVVRPDDGLLAALLEQEGCAVTSCPDADLGMGHSLAHGVRETADASGWVIALADMPSIRPGTIRRVVNALDHGAGIAVPSLHGERGHPVGFARQHYAELVALEGDAGARAVMEANRNELMAILCDDPGVVYDIDRKSDLKRQV